MGIAALAVGVDDGWLFLGGSGGGGGGGTVAVAVAAAATGDGDRAFGLAAFEFRTGSTSIVGDGDSVDAVVAVGTVDCRAVSSCLQYV